MSYQHRTLANSSYGIGIRISLDKGKRFEEFLNTATYWYYASEIVLGDSYHDWEMKMPTLGDLSIYTKKWDEEGEGRIVAAFPRGSWEFARLIEAEEHGKVISGDREEPQEDNSRNYCPQGCFVQGWEDLKEETKNAHMEFLHTGKIRKSPFQ